MRFTSFCLPSARSSAMFLVAAVLLPAAAHAQIDVSAVYRTVSADACGGANLPSGDTGGGLPGFSRADDGPVLQRVLSADCHGVTVTATADQSAQVGPSGISVTARYQASFNGAPRKAYPEGQTPSIQDLTIAPSMEVSVRALGQVHVDFSVSEQTEFLLSGSNSVPLIASLYDGQQNEYLLEAFSQIRGKQRAARLTLGPGQYTLDINGGVGLSLGYFEGFTGSLQNSQTVAFSMQAVPEPGAWALVGVGMLGVAFARRGRRAQ